MTYPRLFSNENTFQSIFCLQNQLTYSVRRNGYNYVNLTLSINILMMSHPLGAYKVLTSVMRLCA